MTGPAFGVPLYEMPDNSWCTSLIGGQKHELPLVVFTVIEEIYHRGESFLPAMIVSDPQSSLIIFHSSLTPPPLQLLSLFIQCTAFGSCTGQSSPHSHFRTALTTRNVSTRNIPTRWGRYPNLTPDQGIQHAAPLR